MRRGPGPAVRRGAAVRRSSELLFQHVGSLDTAWPNGGVSGFQQDGPLGLAMHARGCEAHHGTKGPSCQNRGSLHSGIEPLAAHHRNTLNNHRTRQASETDQLLSSVGASSRNQGGACLSLHICCALRLWYVCSPFRPTGTIGINFLIMQIQSSRGLQSKPRALAADP